MFVVGSLMGVRCFPRAQCFHSFAVIVQLAMFGRPDRNAGSGGKGWDGTHDGRQASRTVRVWESGLGGGRVRKIRQTRAEKPKKKKMNTLNKNSQARTNKTVPRDHRQHQHHRRHLQVPRHELQSGRARPQGFRGVPSAPPPCRSISAGLAETSSPRPSIRGSTA